MSKPISTKNLTVFITQQNFMRGCFKQTLLTIPKNKAECEPLFEMLENMLSPENISCDGERPRHEVIRLTHLYEGAWKELEAIAGEKREAVI